MSRELMYREGEGAAGLGDSGSRDLQRGAVAIAQTRLSSLRCKHSAEHAQVVADFTELVVRFVVQPSTKN